MADYFILMGDIVGSRRQDARQLRKQLQSLLSSCNRELKAGILSPYTTTLGDEFQGVAVSLRAVAESIFHLEETGISREHAFKLRYVAHYGEIETAINREIAYEMMGPGLTRARTLLSDKRRGQSRFTIDLPEQGLSETLTRLCRVIEGVTGRWNRNDYKLIHDMLGNPSNEEVAARHGKNRTQIWKRRKHLLVEEYRLTKAVVFDLIDAREKRK